MFGLDRLDIIVNPQNVELFYRRYDSDQDGRIGFWEFSNALLPIDFRYREEVEQREAGYEMSMETREAFRGVLRSSIDVETRVEHLR
jgi:hypothetical protein